jgi:hypothetical protein
MQFKDRIDAIEVRAGRVNLTLHALCARVDVDFSIVYRWKTDEAVNPGVKTVDRHLGKLEGGLDDIEKSILRDLSRRASRPSRGRCAV